MPERNNSSSDYRFGFNGQEKTDELKAEGNHNTALFWEYDTRLGVRWNQDPKPNPSLSNYVCFANNPIWYTDIPGDTAFRFNSKGYFLGVVDDGKEEWSIQVVTKTDVKKGYIIIHYNIHQFNDPKSDVPNMKKLTEKYGNKAKLLYLKSEEDVHKYIDDAGATSKEARADEWKYAKKESIGKMDFWSVTLSQESEAGGIEYDDVMSDRGAFYVFEGSGDAYNTMDAGNYLWAGSMKNLGFSELISRLGAHYNNATNDAHTGIFDSPGDQSAISDSFDKTKVYPDKATK